MDYCSGGDLSMYIRARGKIETLEYVPEPGAAPIYFPHPKTGGLDQRVVRSLLLQLADALKFLRDRNLMHRDLKPQVSRHLYRTNLLSTVITIVCRTYYCSQRPQTTSHWGTHSVHQYSKWQTSALRGYYPAHRSLKLFAVLRAFLLTMWLDYWTS